MADVLTLVLVGIAIYTVIAMGLNRAGYLPGSMKVSGPILTIHTQRGRKFLDRLSQRKRFWRAWGNLGVGITLVFMVLSGIVVVFSVLAIISEPEQSTIQSPQNVLVIPGVNSYLPLSVAAEIIFGLLVGLVVHEGGHGLLCRVEEMEIDSMGVALFALVPLGAFVEPDAEDQQTANRGAQARMFAAGITNNFAVTIISLVGLVAVISTISVVGGVPVGDTYPGSGATDAGIERGDVITAINGTSVENTSELDTVLADTESKHLEVSRQNGEDVIVERRLLITGVVPGVIENVSFNGETQPRVQAINGTEVGSEKEFAKAVQNRTVISMTTNRGNGTFRVGAYAFAPQSGGPMASALKSSGVLAENEDLGDLSIIITRIDGERVPNGSAIESTVASIESGETVSVDAYIDGQNERFDLTMGTGSDAEEKLGVFIEEGYSGVLFNDFGVDAYPAELFLANLGPEGLLNGPPISSFVGYMGGLLLLPFASLVDPDLAYNFAGFTSDVAGFFVVEGPLSPLGGGVMLLANLLFWTWWINFNLAIFNCIPTFPLDGGHILRATTESLVSRLPIPYRRQIVSLVMISVTIVMVGALLVMVFGPVWLS